MVAVSTIPQVKPQPVLLQYFDTPMSVMMTTTNQNTTSKLFSVALANSPPSLRHLLSILAFIKLCAAYELGQWAPPGHDDFRGPCPMMNTLANHGYIPRDGRNITKHNAIIGLGTGLNFDADLASLMWDQAIVANPEPNATFFTLRTDAYFNPNQVFNQTIFDGTKTWWTDESLSPLMLANSKLARQLESRRDNPEYKFTASTEEFSLGELAAPVIAFGNLCNGEVSRALVTYFFGKSTPL
ncbi:hypothetical protein MY3296_001539 [Beauveria thailandica]